jgi:hypothetical protein
MLFTSGDGLVLRWSNAQRTAAELRAAVLRIPGVRAATKER